MQAINQSVESLAEVGFVAPPWEELAREIVVPPNAEDADPNQPRVGWQASASRLVESSFLEALRLTLMPKVPFSGPKEGHWRPHHLLVSR